MSKATFKKKASKKKISFPSTTQTTAPKAVAKPLPKVEMVEVKRMVKRCCKRPRFITVKVPKGHSLAPGS